MTEQPIDAGPMPVSEVGKGLDELVSLGCKFVVDGEVFKTVIDLLEKLTLEGCADRQGEEFLTMLRLSLLQTSIPVNTRVADENKVIVPEKKIVLPS